MVAGVELCQAMMSKISTKWQDMKTGAKMQEVRAALAADSKGWLVCLAVLIITVVRSGLTYSFGLFIVKLESIYHRPMAEQNWIGTLSFCISLSTAPLSVTFIRFLGHRGYRIGGLVGTLILSVSTLGSSFVTNLEWLFFTHSLLYGIGSSLIYMASSLVIGDYFNKEHKYHVLATSLLLIGYPIGSLLFNPIHAWLIDSFTWRVAFRVTSGLILVTGTICCWNFTAKETPDMERLTNEDDDSIGGGRGDTSSLDAFADEGDASHVPRRCCTWQEVRQRPEIVLWYIGNMLSYLGFYMPFINLASYMQRKGIKTTWASLAITMLSLAECLTYVTASFLGDYLKDRLVYVNVASCGALATICIVWPLIDITYGLILVISLAMGGFLGLNIVYTYAASAEVTQLPIDIAWSCTNLWSGIGILIGPLFSGAVFDLHDSYTEVFFVVGCVYIVDTVVFAAIPLIQSRRESQQQRSSSSFDDLKNGTRFETFRISAKRSVSKSSLANGELEVGGLNGSGGSAGTTSGGLASGVGGSVVSPYGTIANSSREPAPPVVAGAEAYSNLARNSIHAD